MIEKTRYLGISYLLSLMLHLALGDTSAISKVKHQFKPLPKNRTALSQDVCTWSYDVSAGDTYSCCATSTASSVEYMVTVPCDSDDNFEAKVYTDSSYDYVFESTSCKVTSNNNACSGTGICSYYDYCSQYDCERSQITFYTPSRACFRFKCNNWWYDCGIWDIVVSFSSFSAANPPSPSPPPPSPPPSGGSASTYSPSYTGTGSSNVRLPTITTRKATKATGKIAGAVVGVVVTFLIAVVKYCCFSNKNETTGEGEQNTTPPVTVLVQQQNTGRDEPAAMPTMPMEAKAVSNGD